MLIIKRHVQALIDKGAFTNAIGAAAEYVRRNPDCAAGHQLVAMGEEAAGYTKAAIQSISHAINLSPEEPSFRVMRARLLVRDHRVKEAIADVEVIIALGDARCDGQLLSDAIACRGELLERLSPTFTATPVQCSPLVRRTPASRLPCFCGPPLGNRSCR